jgi:hypothetical protein
MTHHEPSTPIDAKRSKRIERIYVILSGDDRYERSCSKIPESDCTNLPKNYLLNIINGSASKLAEQVASAKLAIPWLMGALGAPALLVGLLLPLRQAGTLLPQLAVSGTIRSFPIRKWFWAGAALVQALMLLVIVAASALPPTAAGVVMVTGLLIFSMARGVGSVAFQDVTGKTIPKGKRGKLLAARGMIGGLLTIAAGILLKAYSGASSGPQPALILICCGAVLWVVAALAFAAVKEAPGAVGGGRTPLKEAAAGLALLRREVWFRRFLLVRTALLSSRAGQSVLRAVCQSAVSITGRRSRIHHHRCGAFSRFEQSHLGTICRSFQPKSPCHQRNVGRTRRCLSFGPGAAAG